MYVYAFVYVYVSEHDSFKPLHSIELKFGMHITEYRRTGPTDFGEFRKNKCFTGAQMYFYALRPIESNSLKCSSI